MATRYGKGFVRHGEVAASEGIPRLLPGRSRFFDHVGFFHRGDFFCRGSFPAFHDGRGGNGKDCDEATCEAFEMHGTEGNVRNRSSSTRDASAWSRGHAAGDWGMSMETYARKAEYPGARRAFGGGRFLALVASLALFGAALPGLSPVLPASAAAAVHSFALESFVAVPGGGVAEIVTATPDGRFLYYTNASGKKVGVLDISDPASPKGLPSLDTGDAEPTSAAVSKDGRVLLVALRNGDTAEKVAPGTVAVYALDDPKAPRHLGNIAVGTGPDSLAVTERDGAVVAVVAIEDEESDAEGEATLGGKRPGRVDVITLNLADVAASRVASVTFPEEMLAAVPGVNFPADPQPEFVAISSSGTEAAVTLQENNATVILDISDPANPKVARLFCAGTAERKADLKKDGEVAFTQDFKGRREPDAVAYLTVNGREYLVLANEGDTDVKTFGDEVWAGGRGVSVLDTAGAVLWDSGLALDEAAALLGHYPDGRSHKKGTEMEGVTTGVFLGETLLAAASERGSFLAVYRVNDPAAPELLQILPTGISPEGVLAVTGRSDGKALLVTANEGDGTLNIFSARESAPAADPTDPRIVSKSIFWSAVSGLTTDGTFLYAVPDNAWAPSRIWRIDMSGLQSGTVEVDRAIPLHKDGKPVAYDLEGICRTDEGFWLVSEGKTGAENLLLFADEGGTVKAEYPLPEALLAAHGDPKNYGFEGVATADGKTVYVALQRGFDPEKSDAAILRFSVASGTWETAAYPLERHSKDPKKFWMGLSDLVLADPSTLLVVERDKGMGGTAEVKRIYAVDLKGYTDGGRLAKRLVCDIAAERGLLLEKVESLVLLNGHMWIATDNDGAGWTRLLDLGPVR